MVNADGLHQIVNDFTVLYGFFIQFKRAKKFVKNAVTLSIANFYRVCYHWNQLVILRRRARGHRVASRKEDIIGI